MNDPIMNKEEAGRLMLLVLRDLHKWSGRAYPYWLEVEATILLAEEAGIHGPAYLTTGEDQHD